MEVLSYFYPWVNNRQILIYIWLDFPGSHKILPSWIMKTSEPLQGTGRKSPPTVVPLVMYNKPPLTESTFYLPYYSAILLPPNHTWKNVGVSWIDNKKQHKKGYKVEFLWITTENNNKNSNIIHINQVIGGTETNYRDMGK